MRQQLRQQLESNAYPGYVYGYPHKKAYRPLPSPVPLEEVWKAEPRDGLFCYVHIPFCTQRCSFCNLFTYVPTGPSPTHRYLDALAREMEAVARALGSFRFRRLYIGGGTPSYLDPGELARLGRLLRDLLGIDPRATHGCIETSPETIDQDRLEVLRDLGFDRISLGVQSLVGEELRQVNRRFDFDQNARAVEQIGQMGFPNFNIDLIYGLPGQTELSWQATLEQAVASPATSLFLYPLYIRPMTGLDRRVDLLPCPTQREMGRLYDIAVKQLTEAGFQQLSMRQFRRDPLAGWNDEDQDYRCQRDGMIGLGAGARSYTRALHYSTPWRMVSRNIRAVVEDYCDRMEQGEVAVQHGIFLDDEEQQRRYVIQMLLSSGLSLKEFQDTFGICARERFAPEWKALEEEDCISQIEKRIRLTARGVRHADVVGQVFFSERVLHLMETYEYDR